MNQSIIKLKEYLSTKWQQLIKWINAHKKLSIIIGAILMVVLLASGYVLFRPSNNNETSETQDTNNTAATLRIESNIPGISMSGSPYCDSIELNTVTPYDCELPEDATETTTIIAPEEVTIGGTTYAFQTWEGCSEGNTDWKVCKKVLVNNKTEKITATYGPKDSSAAPGSTPTPNTAPGTPPTSQTYVPYEPNHTQCKDTTILNASTNKGTCTVKISSRMRLFMGIDWSPSPGTEEPKISIICNPAGGGDCTWSAYRNNNLKQATFPPATPYIINGEYQMGEDALNSSMAVAAPRTSTTQILYNNWTVTFPINYSSGGQNFMFDSSLGYDNWSGHGTSHDYYVTLRYKKVN